MCSVKGRTVFRPSSCTYLANLTGAVVAMADDLIVMDNKVYYRAPEGGFQRVSIIHRLALDRMLDPLCFDENTPCGIPHLMEVYCAGNIAIINAPGCSVAEDRGLFCFIPAMIRYYLDEEPCAQRANLSALVFRPAQLCAVSYGQADL